MLNLISDRPRPVHTQDSSLNSALKNFDVKLALPHADADMELPTIAPCTFVQTRVMADNSTLRIAYRFISNL